jgi:ABC-type dipeptide/oligopeptide/nickel transport system ATPase component
MAEARASRRKRRRPQRPKRAHGRRAGLSHFSPLAISPHGLSIDHPTYNSLRPRVGLPVIPPAFTLRRQSSALSPAMHPMPVTAQVSAIILITYLLWGKVVAQDYVSNFARTINFPPSMSPVGQSQSVKCDGSIVVVGANGSGKSRLGAWLEQNGPQRDQVFRITAQKSLVFPESSSPVGIQSARDAFYWAPRPSNWDEQTYEQNKNSLRLHARYGGNLTNIETAPLNDFDKLLTLLFSENYATLLAHEDRERATNLLERVPSSTLRKVQDLWEQALPRRKLKFEGSEVRATVSTEATDSYPARAMSDGERVIFYLIGQCLSAPANSIVLVDEPELHLHKAIQTVLWNSIENARPDCIFVYLTHDLEFAAGRNNSTKVCLADYINGAFSWFSVPAQEEIPEAVYLEILGSRKPILFVEGMSESHDLSIYKIAYPQFTVKPVGGCAAVVSATKAFRKIKDVHRLECFGLVDRDYLEDGQIESYKRTGIFTPKVAEVENLYLIAPLVVAVAEQLLLDGRQVLPLVTDHVISLFKRTISVHAIELTRHKVALQLGRFSSQNNSIEEYSNELKTFTNTIDACDIYSAALNEAKALIDENDYDAILKIFNKKDLISGVDRFFDIKKPTTYVGKVHEMAKRGLGDVPTKLLDYLPDLAGMLPQPQNTRS